MIDKIKEATIFEVNGGNNIWKLFSNIKLECLTISNLIITSAEANFGISRYSCH